MPSTIKIKSFVIELNLKQQLAPSGKLIRLSGIEKVNNDKWINGVLKSHWIYTFRYVGTDEYVRFEFDYNENFFKIHNT